MSRIRKNGEGSFYHNGQYWVGYVWVETPAGTRKRVYVKSKDEDTARSKWIKLRAEAEIDEVKTNVPTLGAYAKDWLKDIVGPNLGMSTYAKYESHLRVHILPSLGKTRLDKLTTRKLQTWINRVRSECRCCKQELDSRRANENQRCCAKGECCETKVTAAYAKSIVKTLRSLLSEASKVDQLISRNPAEYVKVPVRKSRSESTRPWSLSEASQFLQSAREDDDPLYEAYVLILALGLRRGELLGLPWIAEIPPGDAISIYQQLQRHQGKLHLVATKTNGSEAVLPLPEICQAALASRRKKQEADQALAGNLWQNTEKLIFTTKWGTPVEPRNFHRSWKRRCELAGVRPVAVHTARRTCATLLVELGVHPRVIMQILRHAQISMTMDIYAHTTSEATSEALSKLGKSLG